MVKGGYSVSIVQQSLRRQPFSPLHFGYLLLPKYPRPLRGDERANKPTAAATACSEPFWRLRGKYQQLFPAKGGSPVSLRLTRIGRTAIAMEGDSCKVRHSFLYCFGIESHPYGVLHQALATRITEAEIVAPVRWARLDARWKNACSLCSSREERQWK